MEEMVRPLAGIDWWVTPAGAGVPSLKVTDGPSGARGEEFNGGPPSVWFPCGAAVGATWDVALVERLGAALGAEASAKGAHVLLAPTVNLQRDPLGGRHFECMAEDPVLTAHLAAAYVRGVQSTGIGACTKHLVANDAEDDRFEVSSDVDERTLREVYLLPFEHALRLAGSWSVMSAYNRLNGEHCSQNRWLLTEVLRDDWGWDGAVISDWFGTRDTVGAALGGLDLEMPGPPIHFGPKLQASVERGDVPGEVIEAKLEHLRLLATRTGAVGNGPRPDGPGGAEEPRAVAREVAAAGAVLLRNEERCLPLDASSLGTLAVIGPNADREIVGGGGSARLTPTEVVTVLDALVAALGADRVLYEEGTRADRGTPAIDGRRARRADGSPGVDAELRDGSGAVTKSLRPRDFRVVIGDDMAPDGWSVTGRCHYSPPTTGPHRFKVRTNLDAELSVDGTVVVSTGSGATEAEVELVEGSPVLLEVTGRPTSSDAGMFRGALEVRCAPPAPPDGLERAARTAAAADAAVVIVGLDGEWETEGRDRNDLALPGAQVDLIRAVAAAQPRTAVVVLAGAPVDVSWAGEVPALLWGWYPGQEGGTAIADVLFGEAEPGGRLPCTLPARLEDTLADVAGRGSGHVRYDEGVFVGHRRYDRDGIEPAFPFGAGLSYSSFRLGPPVLSTDRLEPTDGATVTVSVDVENTGDRAGSEVVQLYVRDVEASVERPERELRGYAKVGLGPGEATTAAITIGLRDLAFWDTAALSWKAEAGTYELLVGRSSRELIGSVGIELTGDWTAPAGVLPR